MTTPTALASFSTANAPGLAALLTLSFAPDLTGPDRASLEEHRDRIAELVARLDAGQEGEATAAPLRAECRAAAEEVRDLCQAALFSGLETAIGSALAPFFAIADDGASLARMSDAWPALESFLEPDPEPSRETLPGVAQWALDTLGALLDGPLVWTYQGATAAPATGAGA